MITILKNFPGRSLNNIKNQVHSGFIIMTSMEAEKGIFRIGRNFMEW